LPQCPFLPQFRDVAKLNRRGNESAETPKRRNAETPRRSGAGERGEMKNFSSLLFPPRPRCPKWLFFSRDQGTDLCVVAVAGAKDDDPRAHFVI
jgi:hypothetical protein